MSVRDKLRPEGRRTPEERRAHIKAMAEQLRARQEAIAERAAVTEDLVGQAQAAFQNLQDQIDELTKRVATLEKKKNA